jgi:hypothetical protein
MGQTHLVSRREASQLLAVAPQTVDSLARKNGLVLHQLPGHSRRYYVRSEIMRLIAESNSSFAAVPLVTGRQA